MLVAIPIAMIALEPRFHYRAVMSAEVVDAQVDAYNRHDLESFLTCYSPDVTVQNGRGETLLSGIDALRRQYGGWFTDYPDLHVEVRHRLSSGTWVVDEEHVTMTGNVMDGLVGYHVSDGLIDAVVMLTDAA
jgi:hypothetical protein